MVALEQQWRLLPWERGLGSCQVSSPPLPTLSTVLQAASHAPILQVGKLRPCTLNSQTHILVVLGLDPRQMDLQLRPPHCLRVPKVFIPKGNSQKVVT